MILGGVGLILYGLLYAACRWAENMSHKDAVTQAGFLATALALPLFVLVFLYAYFQGVVLSALM